MISETIWNKRGEIGTLLTIVGVSFMLALVIATQQIRNTTIKQKASAQTVSACAQYCVSIGADNGYCPLTNSCTSGGNLSTYTCSKTSKCCCVFNPVLTSNPVPSPTATPRPSNTPSPTPYLYAACKAQCESVGYDNGVCAAKGATQCPSGTTSQPNGYICSSSVLCCCSFLPTQPPPPTNTPTPTKTPTPTYTPTPTPYIYAACQAQCESVGYDNGVCAAKGATQCPSGNTPHPNGYICSSSVLCCCSFVPSPTNTPIPTATKAPTATPTPSPVCTDPDGENNTSVNFVIAGKTTVSQWNATKMVMENVDYYDKCSSSISGGMTEYHCINGNIAYTDRACATGFSCVSGACKPVAATATPIPTATKTPTPTPTSVCTDPDGENNTSTSFATAGTTTVTQWNGTAMQTVPYVDKCVTEGVLENFCLNRDIAYYRGPCRPAGTTCVSGACKPVAATATPIPTATKTPTPTKTLTPTPIPTIVPGAACAISINTSALNTGKSMIINTTSSVSSIITPATGYTAVSTAYVIDSQVPATLVLTGSPYIVSTSPYKMTLTAGGVTGTARISARGTVKNTSGSQFYCDATPITITINNPPTPTPTATKTPTPIATKVPTLTPIATKTPTPTTIAVSVTPSAPCTRKKMGDADCKADSLNKWTSLIDFEIWRSEKFAGCRYDNLSACGSDIDGDGSPMDANFNYMGSGNLPEESDNVVDMIDFNIWLMKGFNQENSIN